MWAKNFGYWTGLLVYLEDGCWAMVTALWLRLMTLRLEKLQVCVRVLLFHGAGVSPWPCPHGRRVLCTSVL